MNMEEKMTIRVTGAKIIPIGPDTGYPKYLTGFGIMVAVQMRTYGGFLMIPFVGKGKAIEAAAELGFTLDTGDNAES